jgi:hypothetical protein
MAAGLPATSIIGRIDLINLPIDGSILLLENDTQMYNKRTGLYLRGTKTSRDALGALVRVQGLRKVAGRFGTQRRELPVP